MNFSLSVLLLAEVLARMAPNTTSGQSASILTTPLAHDEILALRLDLARGDPARVTVTALAINGSDRLGALTAHTWLTSHNSISTSGTLTYQVIQGDGPCAPLLISSHFEETQPIQEDRWELDVTDGGEIAILSSIANGALPDLTDLADGRLRIES